MKRIFHHYAAGETLIGRLLSIITAIVVIAVFSGDWFWRFIAEARSLFQI